MPGDVYNWGGDSRYSKHKSAYRGQRNFSVLPKSPSEVLEPDRAPEPPPGSRARPQHPVFVFLNRLLTLLLITSIATVGLFYFLRMQFDRPGPLNYSSVFVVPRGDGLESVARRLEKEGIIVDRWTFMIAAYYFKVHRKIKAGEYNIKAQASLRDVLDTLVEGKAILYSVTIPEGLTSYQVVERLNAHPDLVGDITEMPAEGSMLPETYRFARNTTRDELIRRMQAEQKKFIESVWETRVRDLPFKTPDEAINLASIVEKEASRADERPRVAAVYVNRLRKRMRLDADPTVIYGVTQGRTTLNRGILRSELDAPNPYNTYRNTGLPPTPIGNPGRAAIEAVLRPAETNEIFFVADGTGGHVFAENYADHQKNVAKWRAIERERRLQEAQRGGAPVGPDDEAEEVAAGATGNGAAKPSAAGASIEGLQLVEIPLPQRKPAR
jgi:UPF0755 protein